MHFHEPADPTTPRRLASARAVIAGKSLSRLAPGTSTCVTTKTLPPLRRDCGMGAAEAFKPSRSSIEDISSGRRGGLRSHSGPGGRTYRQLYAEAQRRGIDGRSKMSKAQLERVLDR